MAVPLGGKPQRSSAMALKAPVEVGACQLDLLQVRARTAEPLGIPCYAIAARSALRQRGLRLLDVT